MGGHTLKISRERVEHVSVSKEFDIISDRCVALCDSVEHIDPSASLLLLNMPSRIEHTQAYRCTCWARTFDRDRGGVRMQIRCLIQVHKHYVLLLFFAMPRPGPLVFFVVCFFI